MISQSKNLSLLFEECKLAFYSKKPLNTYSDLFYSTLNLAINENNQDLAMRLTLFVAELERKLLKFESSLNHFLECFDFIINNGDKKEKILVVHGLTMSYSKLDKQSDAFLTLNLLSDNDYSTEPDLKYMRSLIFIYLFNAMGLCHLSLKIYNELISTVSVKESPVKYFNLKHLYFYIKQGFGIEDEEIKDVVSEIWTWWNEALPHKENPEIFPHLRAFNDIQLHLYCNPLVDEKHLINAIANFHNIIENNETFKLGSVYYNGLLNAYIYLKDITKSKKILDIITSSDQSGSISYDLQYNYALASFYIINNEIDKSNQVAAKIIDKYEHNSANYKFEPNMKFYKEISRIYRENGNKEKEIEYSEKHKKVIRTQLKNFAISQKELLDKIVEDSSEQIKSSFDDLRLSNALSILTLTEKKPNENLIPLVSDNNIFFNPFFLDKMQKVKSTFTSLTKTEVRIATLIILNISNKDIAYLLVIESRTVDKNRQNIRKKLNIDPQEELYNFLAKVFDNT